MICSKMISSTAANKANCAAVRVLTEVKKGIFGHRTDSFRTFGKRNMLHLDSTVYNFLRYVTSLHLFAKTRHITFISIEAAFNIFTT